MYVGVYTDRLCWQTICKTTKAMRTHAHIHMCSCHIGRLLSQDTREAIKSRKKYFHTKNSKFRQTKSSYKYMYICMYIHSHVLAANSCCFLVLYWYLLSLLNTSHQKKKRYTTIKTLSRSNNCLITRHPKYFLLLFCIHKLHVYVC